MVSCCTARISSRQIRAVRQKHKLLELFSLSKLDDTDSTGDAEEYEREFETVIFAGALLLAVSHVVLIAYGQSMV